MALEDRVRVLENAVAQLQQIALTQNITLLNHTTILDIYKARLDKAEEELSRRVETLVPENFS